ncbi:protein kinase [Actinomycetes bacterium KLBMP 9759]
MTTGCVERRTGACRERAPGLLVPEQQSTAAAGLVGHVVAGHRIDALIGEGGMGVVYRATHLRLQRAVALKVLPPPLAADQDYRRRFEREAAIAASLEHPNVVPIYDAGHANGLLYLSMRFVDGEDLGSLLRREGPLGVERVCALLGPVADALDAVHEAGLVHRDVKPGNVLIARTVRPNGHRQVYLCDFGIAKSRASGPDLTTAGQYVGTLQYSSPEQIEGRWLDGRSDQYGLACLVFRALTGQVPYPRDDSIRAVIYAHLAAEPPRPRVHRPDLPAAVDAVVTRAAAKHPDHRFPTCSAFVAALRSTLVPTPRQRPRPSTSPAAPPVAPAAGPVRAPVEPVRGDVRPQPAPRRLPPTLPLPQPSDPDRPTRRAEHDEPPAAVTPAADASAPEPPAPQPPTGDPSVLPAPTDVRARRGTTDPSITITWTPGGREGVEYKISRRTPDGRWQVVGRTAATSILDGAVAPDAAIPVYGVVARLGSAVSEVAESLPAAESGGEPPGIPPARHLTVTSAGPLLFEWPSGVTEAMVVVRQDRAPESPDDPAATAWKITNMRYELDGGLVLPPSIPRPCHVAVASCERSGGTLVVAPTFDPTAHTAVGA